MFAMFGLSKKRNPETLAKQFFPIVLDPAASEEFWTAFEATDDVLVRACVSRFCYLEFVAVYHAIQRRGQRLGEQILASFLFLITLSFEDRRKLFPINGFFASTLELQLVLARLRLEYTTPPEFLPFEMLTRMALKMRNEDYSRLVNEQTDLAVVLMCIASSIRSEIHGGLPIQVGSIKRQGDQVSCLSNDWNRIEAVVDKL